MRTTTVTIYCIVNPLGVVCHAFSDEMAAKKDMLNTFLPLGEKYSLEPVAFTLDEEFVKRISLLMTKEFIEELMKILAEK
ncbi:hypothetical protein [Fusobacterium ulcerans]|uniref:hypothetical protein n=1 Tax=Fusobacterium ulcerans TaxID=861 RepID=UPI0026DB9C77|nr:hypothetical protein [Fusobacterium ulcerans]